MQKKSLMFITPQKIIAYVAYKSMCQKKGGRSMCHPGYLSTEKH